MYSNLNYCIFRCFKFQVYRRSDDNVKARAKARATASNPVICVASSSGSESEPEQANQADHVEGASTGAGPRTPDRRTVEQKLETVKIDTAASPSQFWTKMMDEADGKGERTSQPAEQALGAISDSSLQDIEIVADESADEAKGEADSERNANIESPPPAPAMPVAPPRPSGHQIVPLEELPWEAVLKAVYPELQHTTSKHKMAMKDHLLPFLYEVLRECHVHGGHDPRTLTSKALDRCQAAGRSFWGLYDVYSRRRSVAWNLKCLISFYMRIQDLRDVERQNGSD